MVLKKNKNSSEEPKKRIQIRKDDPVAKALMEKQFQKQVLPSAKKYDRKKQRKETRKAVDEV